MQNFKQYLTESASLRDSLINTGKKTCGYMNCKLFVQTVTNIPALDDLPSKPFTSIDELIIGNILKWGTGQHWAIYLGNGEIMEVAEWGGTPRTMPLDKMLELEDMELPDMVYSINNENI